MEKYPNIHQTPTRAKHTLHFKKLQVFLPKRRMLLEKYLTGNETITAKVAQQNKTDFTVYNLQDASL